MIAAAVVAASLGAPAGAGQLCDWLVGGATAASRDSTIQSLEFGSVTFSQGCEEAEARGPGILDLTGLGQTELVLGSMASIDVLVRSCTLAWPNRYAEVFLDWRGTGQFEQL